MSLISPIFKTGQGRFCQQIHQKCFILLRHSTSSAASSKQDIVEDNFRILDLKQTSVRQSFQRRTKDSLPKAPPPRTNVMPVNQDWTSVWPGPRTFHPASVPLPIRQGVNKLGPSPAKFGNAELMKIPNFLHLTPPAIKKHCKALKKFCSSWPKELKSDPQCKKYFPLEVITSDYCHSSPKIRDPLARIVTITIPLCTLEFDKHSKDKFLRLVGDSYDKETDLVTIVTDKCPLKQQNLDYALYLLTALYHESWITEPWESEKSEADMEYYDWEKSVSKKNIEEYFKATNRNLESSKSLINDYKNALVALFDEGENEYTLQKYRETSKKLFMSTSA